MTKRLNREIEWLKREKYKGEEVGLRVAKSDFARLKKGEPIDYVIGWKEFLGCKIDLSARPLIPREETEFWVESAIRDLKATSYQLKALRVLDLFSGSGCIGFAILKHVPNAKVTFGDLHPINKRTIKTNIFSNIKGKFDVIFANPPYIPTQKSKVQKSVKDWEPKSALYAGEDGLAIIKKFLKQAKDHLNPACPEQGRRSKIYLEFGFGQKLAIARLLKQFGYAHYQFNKDQFGKYRWVVIQ